MMIVDSQVHIWGANTLERPWPARQAVKAQRDIPLGKDELLREMDAAGVDRVVIVPPSWEGDRNDLALADSVSPAGHAVHGGTAVACRRGSGMGHGPRRVRMAGLEDLASVTTAADAATSVGNMKLKRSRFDNPNASGVYCIASAR